MRRISLVERAGRAVRLVLVAAIALSLVAKLLLWSTDWLEGWASSVDLMLFLLLGAFGVLHGLHVGRTVWGVLSAVGGVFLLVAFFVPAFDALAVVMGVAVVCVLLGALLGKEKE